jgi:ArsR family transcriptional regulator, arsenate/arsenite/antimonite-responsive transcriptional repressor
MGMTETLKALSDPARRRILDMLKEKPLNAGEIAAGFDLTDATISHHLSVLKNAGLIDSTRNGTFITYSLNTSLFEDVINWMASLKGGSEP